jgi:hypothetical protein
MNSDEKIKFKLIEIHERVQKNIKVLEKDIKNKRTERHIKILNMQGLKFFYAYEYLLKDFIYNNTYNKNKHDEGIVEILDYLEMNRFFGDDCYLFVANMATKFYTISNCIKELCEINVPINNFNNIVPVVSV